ncbi:hypothetical protein E3N88_33273 [Mikania micrantha]|uniref:Toprim domain-containing protein n=1 Tax=Mikania micrantha TaxID=192012 RepID=A0A5N6MBI5_9ASTR|nr:hypothetical protein E3N88_33273 [Mikania micrantha]
MISPPQGFFRSIRTCNPHHLHPQSVRRQIPLKSSVNLTNLKRDGETLDLYELNSLKQKVEIIGINFDSCSPGQYTHQICPLCKGGQSKERSLSFHINQNAKLAMWRCFNFECGWAGHVLSDVGPAQDGVNKDNKLSEETLRLEPLGDELINYFAERMITAEILQKNAVMQMVDDKNVIAFTYRRKGEIVNCKFRSITNRKFWQAKHGERILYGLDGIKEGNTIVIVEGEIDKLSMEQAGILNCVSVPDGAPQQVSIKALPSKKQDIRYKYLLDCNGYLDKAPRIILATDGDGPGQALAEELSCRLGKERCWRVTWPKKDEFTCYKDANEVLVHLGPEALRQIVESAKLYEEFGRQLISMDVDGGGISDAGIDNQPAPVLHGRSRAVYQFTQQTLPACKPVLTPAWVIGTFFLIGVIFIPVGLISLHASHSVNEIVDRYDIDCVRGSFKSNKEAYIKNASTPKSCHRYLKVDKPMKAPIYIYYQLDNFYQNHRRYVKSRSDDQLLHGLGYNRTSSCEPEAFENGLPIVPCGLVAWSLFNDTFSFSRGTKKLKIERKNIAWKSDRDHKFGKHVYPFNFQNGSFIGGGKLDTTIPLSEQEDLIVWMRTAAFPSFRKLYGRIEEDLEEDDIIVVHLMNNYNTYSFGGTKMLVVVKVNILTDDANAQITELDDTATLLHKILSTGLVDFGCISLWRREKGCSPITRYV